eukprot:TRINITY_DN121095_c0_g1_i1.p1 TRINITY_DN121095_c0_g1~~TRINITY_DN121095_c0_g1_i1.p1  ORF type:complete len:415 (-),score=60.97 TRINITY_DN121095_c0_g1_i1:96-1340(-)
MHRRTQLGAGAESKSPKAGKSAQAALVANLSKAWGEGGTWHAHGAYPKQSASAAPRETPFNVRGFNLKPAASEPWGSLSERCGLAAINTKGCKGAGDSALGQDNCSIARLSRNWESVCVMDGHGACGEFPSTRAVQTVPLFIDKEPECIQLLKEYNVPGALQRAFQLAQEDLASTAEAERVDLDFSGCTAVCVLRCLERNTVWVGWVGDSRAILIVPETGLVQETADHNLKVEAERARLLSSGCEIADEEIGGGVTISRLYVTGEEFPGLTMSRALGDNYMKEYGVLAEPQVVEWSLENLKDPLLLAATDGVWEFMTSEDVTDIVLKALSSGATPQKALSLVIAQAKAKWAEEGDYCDDITAVIVPMGRSFALPMDASIRPDTAVVSHRDELESSKSQSESCDILQCKNSCVVS